VLNGASTGAPARYDANPVGIYFLSDLRMDHFLRILHKNPE
jgi:hypothetical protein